MRATASAARRRVVVAAVAVAAVAAPPTVQAQGYFGIGGGGSLPVGPTTKASAIGYNALVFLGFGAPDIPLGIRFDGQFNRFQYKNSGPYENIWDGTANLVAPLAQSGTLVPYLIGGMGYYSIQRPSSVIAATTPPCPSNSPSCGSAGGIFYPYGASTGAFGLNGGLGIRTWSGNKFGLFLEARYHYVFSRKPAQPFVPITVGVTF